MQPLESNDDLEEEAERQLLTTQGTAHAALMHAAAAVDEQVLRGYSFASDCWSNVILLCTSLLPIYPQPPL